MAVVTNWVPEPANDVVQAAETRVFNAANGEINLKYQSFGLMYATGIPDNAPEIEIGPNKIIKFTDPETTAGMLTPPDTLVSLKEWSLDQLKEVAVNRHLDVSAVVGDNKAASGVSLAIRNLELTEDRRDDIERWRNVERELFAIEYSIVHKRAPSKAELDKFSVDFSESEQIKSTDEQRKQDEWELAENLTTRWKILIKSDPDKYDGEGGEAKAKAEVKQNKIDNIGEEAPAALPVNIFDSPTAGIVAADKAADNAS